MSREATRDADCVIVDRGTTQGDETWKSLVGNTPVVQVGASVDAENDAQEHLRLAVRGAVLDRRARDLLAELTDAWAHDARGALGVARLGIELLKAGGDSSKPLDKVENGLTRLGWLLERLPSQVALALDLPEEATSASSQFQSLESYVAHVKRTHPRRQIDLVGGPWTSSAASRNLVPFASGLVEFAFKLSSGRAGLHISADAAGELRVECECPDRAPPWDIQQTLGAFELSHRDQAFSPYRLLEAARLALRSESRLTIELLEHTFRGQVQLRAPSSDH
jgi:hypothetical protein